MTHEIFIDEWIYKPLKSEGNPKRFSAVLKVPLEPFQLYVVKLYKLTATKAEDYNVLLDVMKNLRIRDRKIIWDIIQKSLPGENNEKIKFSPGNESLTKISNKRSSLPGEKVEK